MKKQLNILMPPIPENKKVYTVAEFAEELDVPQSSVRRWLKSGELRGTKMGKRWLIPAAEIERLVNPPRGKRPHPSGHSSGSIS